MQKYFRRLFVETLESKCLLAADSTNAMSFGAIPAAASDNATVQILQSINGVQNYASTGSTPAADLTPVGSVLYGTTESGGQYGKGTVFSINADGTGYKVLHAFTGLPNDGASPEGSLTLVGSTLYGTTAGGPGFGTVFSIGLDGSGYKILSTFFGGPVGGLTLAGSTLYGVTTAGGSFSHGTIFSLSLDGTQYRELHSFGDISHDGWNPNGSLTLVGSTLYGTTSAGSGNHGTIFSINTNGTGYAILQSFSTLATPSAGLITDGSVLYGTTKGGGSGNGTIYSISTTGTNFQLLHSFGNAAPDYGQPQSDLKLVGTTLYGTTSRAVFAIGTNGANYQAISTLSFLGQVSDNQLNEGLAIVGSTLFGTTYSGNSGQRANDGTIFSLTLDGSGLQLLYEFQPLAEITQSANHRLPQSALTTVGNLLYGTTQGGGPANGGSIYSMNMDGSNLQVLHSFTGNGDDGLRPLAGMIEVGSVLYGTTEYGGTFDGGTIFSINPDGSDFRVLHSFAHTSMSGAFPNAGLIQAGSSLYGMTEYGGPRDLGEIFSINVDGTNFEIIHYFTGTINDGGTPEAGLTLLNSTLYGTSMQGGAYNLGVAFSIGVDGSDFQVLHSFGADGSDPYPDSELTVIGSTLFGTTGGGGGVVVYQILTAGGTLFSLNLDGSDFQTLHAFSGGTVDGKVPLGRLIATNSKLLGTTEFGGSSNGGIIFSVNADGSDYQLLISFVSGSSSANPFTGLIPVDSVLFGTALNRGIANAGTVYSIVLPAPEVTNVEVGSSAWSSSYLSALQAEGFGDGNGYAIPVGTAAQLQDLPWGNLNQIRIAFNQSVNVQENSLTLTGQNSGQIAFRGFSYDPATFLATWSLASPLPNDRLTLHLQSTGPAAVTNVLGTPLDGNWTNGTNVYPSGNGTAGDFDFAFKVLPGDVNQDGIINTQDIAYLSSSWLQTGGLIGDTNGDGIVNSQDIALVSSNWLASLPPAMAMASAAAMPSNSLNASMPLRPAIPTIGPSYPSDLIQESIKAHPTPHPELISKVDIAGPLPFVRNELEPLPNLVDFVMSQTTMQHRDLTVPSLFDQPEDVLLSFASNPRSLLHPGNE